MFKKIMKSMWFLFAILCGIMISVVLFDHNYKWYNVVLLIISMIYGVWYIYTLISNISKK